MEEIKNISDLILKSSLYNFITIENQNYEFIYKFVTDINETQFDCYCVDCGKDAPFKLSSSDFLDHPIMESSISTYLDRKEVVQSATKPKQLIFSCLRDNNHEIAITLKLVDSNLVKIGQYPSIADLEKHDIEKYKKLLKSDYANLNRAIGLRSHGVGAGSYVYLRRIFEKLIEEKHIEAQLEPGWDDDKYGQSRMREKIKLLEHKLPSILVETTDLYSVLSIGIHELNEKECLEYFPVMKAAIELILDEKLVMLEKEAKTKKLKTSLSSIAATISK